MGINIFIIASGAFAAILTLRKRPEIDGIAEVNDTGAAAILAEPVQPDGVDDVASLPLAQELEVDLGTPFLEEWQEDQPIGYNPFGLDGNTPFPVFNGSLAVPVEKSPGVLLTEQMEHERKKELMEKELEIVEAKKVTNASTKKGGDISIINNFGQES